MVLPCCVCIHTQEIGIVEDLGSFKKLLQPGFNFIPFPLSQVAGTLSLRIQQLDVSCETKTKDNVFIRVEVAVQYRVVTVSSQNVIHYQRAAADTGGSLNRGTQRFVK